MPRQKAKKPKPKLLIDAELIFRRPAKRLRAALAGETGGVVNAGLVRSMIVTLGINVLEVGKRGDGTVDGWSKWDLAECSGWEGDPEQLYNALIKSGFMYVTEGSETMEFPYVMERCDAKLNEAKRRAAREYRKRRREGVVCSSGRRSPVRPEPEEEVKETVREVVKTEGVARQEKREERAKVKIETLRLIPVEMETPTKSKVQEVVDFYRGKFPRRGRHLKPGHREWRKIERLINQGYSVDELRQCVIGNWMCPWHQERRAHAIDYVFRNASKVDAFIEIAQRGLPRRISQTERESVEFLEAQRQIENVVDGGKL